MLMTQTSLNGPPSMMHSFTGNSSKHLMGISSILSARCHNNLANPIEYQGKVGLSVPCRILKMP